MSDERDLKVLLRSRIPVIVIESFEESAALGLLEKTANLAGTALFVWNVVDGLRRRGRDHVIPETRDPQGVLKHIDATPQNGLYALADFHPFLTDPLNLRLIKHIALEHERSGKTLVLVAHRIELPPDLARISARVDLSVPHLSGIRTIVREEFEAYAAREDESVKGQQEALEMLVQQLVGMSAEDARRLVRQAIHDDGAITLGDLGRVLRQKMDALGGAAALTLEVDTAKFDEVAGMKALKRWLDQRRAAFVNAIDGLDPPKGLLLAGVQGAGKSLAARAVAGAWRVPLLRLDFGALYSKWSGETERNLRDALKHAERMAPCVLWIDEIEKGVSTESGESDGGVSRRILGSLLTWMAEREGRVFVVATANAIDALPPELMRKGRIDEIFFVDLPGPEARRDAFRIHLARRRQDPATFALDRLAEAAQGFSGSEIEQAVVSALYASHAAGSVLDDRHVLDELARTRPLSVVASERVEALRHWAAGRAVMADDAEPPSA